MKSSKENNVNMKKLNIKFDTIFIEKCNSSSFNIKYYYKNVEVACQQKDNLNFEMGDVLELSGFNGSMKLYVYEIQGKK